MAIYWMSFTLDSKIVDGKDYSTRWSALTHDVKSISTGWWEETTAFLIFETTKTISEVASVAKAAVSPAHDIVLIRKMDAQSAVIFGPVSDKDVFKLMPYLKTV